MIEKKKTSCRCHFEDISDYGTAPCYKDSYELNEFGDSILKRVPKTLEEQLSLTSFNETSSLEQKEVPPRDYEDNFSKLDNMRSFAENVNLRSNE